MFSWHSSFNILPRPPREHQAQAEKWEEIRDRPITDIKTSFYGFQAQEVSIWKTFGENRSPAHLVQPSGSLESPLAMRLNQPSFTTKFLENSEAADISNGCIAMVMGTAYNCNTLLFDHVHRRSDRSEAIQESEYPEDVLRCHEEFTKKIADSTMAKVEIVYGILRNFIFVGWI
ncbi:hypothetical protein GQ53DRAFT_765030 [Thozetella sp. PMI_491]|nr:hypothetical protein GQ53DRAFT_765030 [Thozetella sp. PMI_491]